MPLWMTASAAVGRAVRVGVAVGRAAVGRPAGVPDAGRPAVDAARRAPARPAPAPGCRACRRACRSAERRRRGPPRRPSRSPGTRAAAARRTTMPSAGRAPAYPTIPHMAVIVADFRSVCGAQKADFRAAMLIESTDGRPLPPNRRRGPAAMARMTATDDPRRVGIVADAPVRHHHLRRDVGARRPNRVRSTSGRASRTPTARRRCSTRPSRRSRSGRNQYPPGPGIPELRAAVAAHQQRFWGLTYDPDGEVLVTAGATEAIAASLLALCEPGDEVVCFEPYYDSYAACITLAQARPRGRSPCVRAGRPVRLRPRGAARRLLRRARGWCC